MMFCPAQKITKETFRQVFSDHWTGFQEKYSSFDNKQYTDVVEKMLGCGKESGGYSEYMCMRCGRSLRRVGFSCKSSFCLSCTKVSVDDFVEQVSSVLHPGVIYRHAILTIPSQHRKYFYRARHDKSLLSSLMRCGYECLEDVVSQVKRQCIKIGAIVVVQTHGRSGQYNPHLHIIMTNGGINEAKRKWVDLNYFPYEIIHKKWQYHLLSMMKKVVSPEETKSLIDDLWENYPNGFVANIKKGDVPEKCRGLAKYLAKYLASPPISVRRIINYDGRSVTYWYNDHESNSRKVETVDVYVFIGRMVQHILPKWLHRIRYYGLQATKTFSRWCKVIRDGLKRIGRIVKGVYQVLYNKRYRERYQEVSGRDPMLCSYCGSEMGLYRVWHPRYGVIHDELENIKVGKYEVEGGNDGRGGASVRPPTRDVQLSLFPLQA